MGVPPTPDMAAHRRCQWCFKNSDAPLARLLTESACLARPLARLGNHSSALNSLTGSSIRGRALHTRAALLPRAQDGLRTDEAG